MPPAGTDETLAFGYLFLLQQLLEHLRYRTDSGHADASRLIDDFQADVVARVEAGDVDGRMIAFVGGALHQSRIPASPELVAASASYAVESPDQGEDELLPADVRAAFGAIFEACDGDPFRVVGGLLESSHAMPAEARGELADALALAGLPEARGAAVLLLLDPDSAVRSAVAGALDQVAASLAPRDVRRLIAMRNWRPENERTQVDAVIRRARAAGIECARWETGGLENVLATAIDGAAAQSFLLVSAAGRKKRLSGVLTKDGIADAWSGEPESVRTIKEGLAETGRDAPVLPVSRAYLDRTVTHHLALSIEKGEAPPLGLLQVAETIGGADWQPARMASGRALAELIAEVPKAMREPAALASVLRRSGELADLKVIARSWCEDDPQVAHAVAGAHVRRSKLASYLLQSVIARRRERWTEIVLGTALWMHEAPPEAGRQCWRELALVAEALADGRDMTEIGLMHDIALRTIAMIRNTRPV